MIKGFVSNAFKFPDHPAIIIENHTYTYAALLNIAYGIATEIKRNNGSGSKLIGVYTDHSVYTYASIIAVLLTGSGFVPINKKFPKDKLQNIIESSGIKLLLCNTSSEKELKSIEEDTKINIIYNDQLPVWEEVPQHQLKIDKASDLAYLLFTSGSTGIPKGIGITHANFSSFIKAMNHSGLYDFKPSDKVLQIFELSFDVSIACTFIAWEAAACLVPTPTSGIVFIQALETIKKYDVTVVSLAPSALAYMKQLRLLEEFEFPQIRYTFFTGEALPYNLAIAWKEIAKNSVIENAYGPTEVTVWSSMYRFDDETAGEVINGLAPIGKVLPGLTYRVCDEQLNPVNTGEFGELLLYGNQVANGYWNNTDKTTSTFIKMNEAGFSGNWYKTGDIVVENKKGNLIYINRKDNQVQINGFRVELGEIEFRIKEFTKKESVVVLPSEQNGTFILLAFIETIGDAMADLKFHLTSTLPVYMIPKKFYEITSMPLNNSGKVDRKKLLELHDKN